MEVVKKWSIRKHTLYFQCVVGLDFGHFDKNKSTDIFTCVNILDKILSRQYGTYRDLNKINSLNMCKLDRSILKPMVKL